MSQSPIKHSYGYTQPVHGDMGVPGYVSATIREDGSVTFHVRPAPPTGFFSAPTAELTVPAEHAKRFIREVFHDLYKINDE